MNLVDRIRKLGSGMAGVSAIYFASRVVPSVLSLVSIKVFYSQLGAQQYGLYVILNSLVLMGANVGSTWLCQSTLRYRSLYEAEGERAVHEAALRIGAFGSAVLLGLAVSVFLSLRGEFSLPAVSVLLALATLLWYSVTAVVAQADMQPVRFFLADGARSVVAFAVAVALLVAGYRTAYTPVVALVVGNVAGIAVFGWSRTRRVRHAAPWAAVRLEVRKYAIYGVPMVAWMLVSVGINTGDRFVVEAMLGAETLGAYAAITDMVYKTAIVVLMPLGSAFHPVIMQAWNRGDAAGAYTAIRHTVLATLGIGAALLIAAFAGGDLLQRFVTGSVVANGRVMVLLATLAAILWQLGVVLQKPLEMRDRTRILSVLALAGWAAQVAVLVTLLPRVGIVAASAALALASGVYCGLVAALYIRLAPRPGRPAGPAAEPALADVEMHNADL